MRYIALFIIMFLFWLLFTFSLSIENVITGAVCALIVTLIFGRYFVRRVGKFLQPERYFWGIIYIFYFLWECLKANLDVAYRVIHPGLPINPGIVKVKLSLKNDISRVILANSITMTPGTIAVDIEGDYIYIHWLSVTDDKPEIYSHKICGKFEKYIRRIFE